MSWLWQVHKAFWGRYYDRAWTTYVNHTAICLVAIYPFLLLMHVWPPAIWLVRGVATAILAFYVGWKVHWGWKGLDTIGDLAGPLLVCALAWILGG